MSKKLALLNTVSNDRLLTKEELSQIDYVNLHAHSTYSLQDAVGQVESHFIETINQGHCGCAITDHGSYASFIDLYNLKENKKGSKRVKKIFESKSIKSHNIVMGSELYIIDDRHVDFLTQAVYDNDRDLIRKTLEKMSKNPKWVAHFDRVDTKSVISINNDEVKSEKDSDLIGKEILRNLDYFSPVELEERIAEFCEKSLRHKSYKYSHITILVKNFVGHQNLCHLTSIGSLPENQYTRPRIKLSDLLKNKDGLIVTTGCFVGMIPHAIHKKTGEENELVELFLKEFGDDFYIEMHVSDISMVWNSQSKEFVPQPEGNPQKVVNDRLLELVNQYGLHDKVYLTQDSHMPKKEDKQIQDIMIINDPRNSSGWHFYNTYSIMSVSEMYEKVRKYYPEYTNDQFINWCFNSLEVMDKCRNVEIDTDFKLKRPDYKNHPSNKPIVPSQDFVSKQGLDIVGEILMEEKIISSFENIQDSLESEKVDREKTILAIEKHKEIDSIIDELFSSNNYFAQKCAHFYRKGDIGTITMVRTSLLSGKFDYKNPELVDTFFKEFNTLQFNGVIPLSDYFMMVENFSYVVRRADEVKGPGRGSAAGCFVSYALDVTDVRPDKYGLLMERFLQKERIGIFYWNHSFLKEAIEDEGSYEAFYQILAKVESLVEEKFKKNYEEEIYYLECNPGVAHYLLKLLKASKGQILKNERNSYICYLLGITDVPAKRIDKSSRSMPDIDYDSSCRDLICDYLLRKHGRDHFAYICSYGAMKIKSAIKDILRVRTINGKLMSPFEVNLITNEVNKVKLSEEDMSEGQLHCFNLILEENSELRNFFEDSPEIKDDVEKMLGTYKSMGIHAAGVIVTEEPITRIVPCTYHTDKGSYITQLAKDEAEQVGLVKLDLLGLQTLEEQRDCARLIRQRHGIDYLAPGKMEQVMDNLPPEVARNYSQAKTVGIFQMNTPIAVTLLRKVKSLTNAIIQNAVFTSLLRPGPMGSGMHLQYVDIINGDIPVSYLHPLLEPILIDTMGTLVYQEQVMRICQDIGGFSKFESDSIRKAMGKKKFDILDKYKSQFVDFAVNSKNVPKEIADEIWNQMAKFAEYGFNKSHAISYSIVSAQSMYFATKYPLEWITSLFSNASKGGSEKDKRNYKTFYREWKDILKTPSISKSKADYEIRDGYIYMPIHTLSKVGYEVAKDLIQLQPFVSFEDFVIKARSIGRLKKDTVEALIYAGCMDEFMPSKKRTQTLLDSDFEKGIESLKVLVDFAKVLFNKSIVFSSLDLIKDRLESGIRVSASEIAKVKEDILVSGIFDVELNIINYRKYLLYKFHCELQHLNIKSALKDVLNKHNINTPDNLALILSKGVNSLIGKYPEIRPDLAPKTKKAKKSNSGQSDFLNPGKMVDSKDVSIDEKKWVSRGPTNGKLDQAFVDMRSVMAINAKKMVLKQLEILKFTTYDFGGTFQEEIQKIQNEKMIRCLTPEAIVEQGNKVLKKAEGNFHLISRLVKKEILDSSTTDILIRERYLRDLIVKGSDVFGWKFKSTVKPLIARETGILPPEKKFSHLFYREFMNIVYKTESIEENYSFQILDILDSEDKKCIQAVLKNTLNLHALNSEKKLSLSMNQIIKLVIAKCVAEKNPLCEIMHSCKPILEIGKNLNDVIGADSGKFIRTFNKLKISETIIKLFSEGVKLFNSGLTPEFKEATESLKSEIELVTLDNSELALLKADLYVFGTVFRPEKKHFLKEFGRDNDSQRVMKVSLNNAEGNINLTVYHAENEMVSRINDKGLVERRKMIDEMKDFTPVIVKAKLQIDLRNFETGLQYSGKGDSGVIFIEDKLN